MSDAEDIPPSKKLRKNEPADFQNGIRRRFLQTVNGGLNKAEELLDEADRLIKIPGDLELDDYEIVYPKSGTTELVVVDKLLGRTGKDGKPRGQGIFIVGTGKDRFETKKQSRKEIEKQPQRKRQQHDLKDCRSYKFSMRKGAARMMRLVCKSFRTFSKVASIASKVSTVVTVINAIKRGYKEMLEAVASEGLGVLLDSVGNRLLRPVRQALRSLCRPLVTVLTDCLSKVGGSFASSTLAEKIAKMFARSAFPTHSPAQDDEPYKHIKSTNHVLSQLLDSSSAPSFLPSQYRDKTALSFSSCLPSKYRDTTALSFPNGLLSQYCDTTALSFPKRLPSQYCDTTALSFPKRLPSQYFHTSALSFPKRLPSQYSDTTALSFPNGLPSQYSDTTALSFPSCLPSQQRDTKALYFPSKPHRDTTALSLSSCLPSGLLDLTTLHLRNSWQHDSTSPFCFSSLLPQLYDSIASPLLSQNHASLALPQLSSTLSSWFESTKQFLSSSLFFENNVSPAFITEVQNSEFLSSQNWQTRGISFC